LEEVGQAHRAQGVPHDVALEDGKGELAERKHAPAGRMPVVERLPAQHFTDRQVSIQDPFPIPCPPNEGFLVLAGLFVNSPEARTYVHEKTDLLS